MGCSLGLAGAWRYADDFVVMVFGTQDHVVALHEEVAAVLAPIGLRLSPSKTRIVHMSDGFDFPGFHIRWRRNKGTRDQWHVYTFIADRPVRSLKDKIRALTHRKSRQDLAETLIGINQITRGWANYFKHAVAKHTFDRLTYFVWWRIVRWVKARRRWRWKDRPLVEAVVHSGPLVSSAGARQANSTRVEASRR